jgi:hypothetical protein
VEILQDLLERDRFSIAHCWTLGNNFLI